jgi:hypothetical protein
MITFKPSQLEGSARPLGPALKLVRIDLRIAIAERSGHWTLEQRSGPGTIAFLHQTIIIAHSGQYEL